MDFFFFIDKITNSIESVATNESFVTDITRVSSTDLKSILKKKGWFFNWQAEAKYEDNQIYKLTVENDTNIQGLLSLQTGENFIELHLIETAPHNRGKSKQYLGVSANLVAFACKMSFEAGFDGFVAFTAKTMLIQHYIDTLGAQLIFRNRMCISGSSAKKLVNSYYKNYLNGR